MADKLPNEKKCTSCFKLYPMKLSRRIDRAEKKAREAMTFRYL